MVKKLYLKLINFLNSKTNIIVTGRFDVVFACLVLTLFSVGLVNMYSASYAYAAYYDGEAMHYFKMQLIFGLVGLIIMLIVSKIDYKAYNSGFAIFAFIMTVIVLVFALIYNAIKHNTNARWLFGVQPSEFAKVSLIIVMSYMICALKSSLRTSFKNPVTIRVPSTEYNAIERFLFSKARTPLSAGFILAMIVAIYSALVLLGSHYSGAIVIFCIGFIMAWLSGAKSRYFVAITCVLGAAVAVILIKPDILEGFGNAYSRIVTWLHPDEASADDIRQTLNGLYAIASGGLFGVGFGNSVQKQLYIPEPQNDFVFPVICEEFGFFGAAFIIILFACLILRGMTIAVKCKNYFGSLLVMGVMIMISLQVIFNIAVVTGLFPNTGMPLPFFSYGGSSLTSVMISMGIVLSVSRDSAIEKQ